MAKPNYTVVTNLKGELSIVPRGNSKAKGTSKHKCMQIIKEIKNV